MVKITNGKDIFEVTRGAFDGIYSRQGYKLIDEEKNVQNNEGDKNPGKTDDEAFVEEIIEKPISQWTKGEVKRFAVLKEIDISGTKNVAEAKEIINEFLKENE